MALTEMPLAARSLEAFDDVLSRSAAIELHAAVAAGREAFAGHTIYNINSTGRGGGVAELLAALLPFARGAGVDARWLVVEGPPEFWALTKRLHNRLHDSAGDGGPLGAEERELYDATLAPAAEQLLDRLRPGDLVLLHDPQTVGLAPALQAAGHPVVWRAHIGMDVPGDLVRSAWAFLEPYVTCADVCVFSRPSYAWDVVPPARRAVVRPTIDPFSPKNRELSEQESAEILTAAGILEGPPAPADSPILRRAVADQEAPLGAGDRYVLQVSRWDALKDPSGVVDGFARHVATHGDGHLVLAGPAVGAVSDDPEGATIFDRTRALCRRLPRGVRARVHLLRLPMDDPDENALMVNALQRRAAVVVQKSLAEGFGLTVAEAMWKARPVVASARGGIRDQIEHGVSGLLLDDPRDGAAFGEAVRSLLDDDVLARDLALAARERVRAEFLSDRSLLAYLSLLAPLAARLPIPVER
jgi:trehalose synthase